jgi:GT2 family glycosyltransferase
VIARKVSVGVVNYNGESYLKPTLRAVERLGSAVKEVLLIDSGSTDGGLALVREHFPHVRVIPLGANLGPGAARNRAIKEATHDRVLLIDNDVEPLPGCIEAFSEALDRHPTAILGMAAVLDERCPETVQHAGAYPHFLGAPVLVHADISVARLNDIVQVVGSAITSCLMVDRARFGNHCWFDERLFLYFEDHELGMRASIQGYDCLSVPSAQCLHRAGTIGVSIRETGRFTPIRVRYTIRNRWLTILMLYQMRTLLRFAPALAVFEILQLFGGVKKGWLGHWLWAAGSTVRSLPHVLRVRAGMRQSRRRADLDILKGGPFPFNKAMHRSALERAAQRALDVVADVNWRIAGGPGS